MGVQTKDRMLNLVLIGRTGAGKSAAGNTILGEKVFKSKFSARSVTQECEKKEGNVSGRPVAVIDTPGLFYTKRSADAVEEEIMKCIAQSAPGPPAFLLVIQLGRMTEEVKETVEQLQEMFGEEAVKHTVLLFTHGDELEDQTIEEFIEDTDEDFQQLVEKFGNRYHVFNNKNMRDRTQVTELLEKIDRMVTASKTIQIKGWDRMAKEEEPTEKKQNKLEKRIEEAKPKLKEGELKQKEKEPCEQMKRELEEEWKRMEELKRECEAMKKKQQEEQQKMEEEMKQREKELEEERKRMEEEWKIMEELKREQEEKQKREEEMKQREKELEEKSNDITMTDAPVIAVGAMLGLGLGLGIGAVAVGGAAAMAVGAVAGVTTGAAAAAAGVVEGPGVGAGVGMAVGGAAALLLAGPAVGIAAAGAAAGGAVIGGVAGFIQKEMGGRGAGEDRKNK